jgi:hypothetical protein
MNLHDEVEGQLKKTTLHITELKQFFGLKTMVLLLQQ